MSDEDEIKVGLSEEESRVYAPVLERMLDIMAEENGTFGGALTKARESLGLTEMPQHVEAALLLAAFRLVGSGRIPGAPDA